MYTIAHNINTREGEVWRSELPHEIRLLLACSRVKLNEESEHVISRSSDVFVDWERLVSTAKHHEVGQLVYRNVQSRMRNSVPPYLLSSLKEDYRKNTLSNLKAAAELVDLADAFRSAGVAALPFRGPTLTSMIYGSLSLRTFRDLDILIEPCGLEQTKAVLTDLGYKDCTDSPHIRQACAFVQHRKHVVEVHWAFSPRPYAFDLANEPIWDALKWSSVGGQRIQRLSDEDQFLLVAANGNRRYWNRLRYVVDAAESLQSCANMDWDKIYARAAKLGSRRMVHVAVLLSLDVLGVEAPENVVDQALRDGAAVNISYRIRQSLATRLRGNQAPENFGFQLQVRERLNERARSLTYRLITPAKIK